MVFLSPLARSSPVTLPVVLLLPLLLLLLLSGTVVATGVYFILTFSGHNNGS